MPQDILTEALKQTSLDATLKIIQDALGIGDGDRAAYEFGKGDERTYATMDPGERATFIRHWLWKELEDAGDRGINQLNNLPAEQRRHGERNVVVPVKLFDDLRAVAAARLSHLQSRMGGAAELVAIYQRLVDQATAILTTQGERQ